MARRAVARDWYLIEEKYTYPELLKYERLVKKVHLTLATLIDNISKEYAPRAYFARDTVNSGCPFEWVKIDGNDQYILRVSPVDIIKNKDWVLAPR